MSASKTSVKLSLILGTALIMTGCSSINPFASREDPPLPGERVSVLELQKDLSPNSASSEATAFIAPQMWENEFWPQRGGYPNHAMQNLAFTTGEFKQLWSVSTGAGASPQTPQSTQPILVGGTIYTLDTKLDLKAFNTANGKQLWQINLKPAQEDDVVIGGGLSFADNTLYAVNGFNEVIALSPQDGKIMWRKPLPAPARAAPTLLNQKLFVQLIDNQILALDSKDGTDLWRYTGFAADSGLLGAASPAATQKLVVAGFSSGELTGFDIDTGAILWSDSLAPRRRIGGITSVSDITALPVIDRDLVIAAGFGGRMLALDAQTGRRVWTQDIGALETPWVANNHIFVMTADRKLISLDRATGALNWVQDMTSVQKNEAHGNWTGPVMAGDRLITASSTGHIAEIDPQNGHLLRLTKTSGHVTVPPLVANGVLYLLSDNGKLTAYR